MTGFFPKHGETFSHPSKGILMLVDQSSPIFSNKAKHAEMHKGRAVSAKRFYPLNVRTLLLGLHVLGLFLHFVANALHLHIFSFSWQPCQLPAVFFSLFASSPPVVEAKHSSLCATSWCPDLVLADVFAAPLPQMGLDKSSKTTASEDAVMTQCLRRQQMSEPQLLETCKEITF